MKLRASSPDIWRAALQEFTRAEPVSTFLHSLRPGDPPDGQAYLRSAFRLYQQQAFEPDPNRRAQTICLANILVGFHEQTRLQPEIREAMTSVPERLRLSLCCCACCALLLEEYQSSRVSSLAAQ